VKFAFVKAHRRVWPVNAICRVLSVTRSGFFAWLKRRVSERRRRREELAEKIKATHEKNRGVYGSPRIFEALRADGVNVCCNTVAKVMRAEGIRGKVKRKFMLRTTDSSHDQPVAANVLDRQFETERPDQKWRRTLLMWTPTRGGCTSPESSTCAVARLSAGRWRTICERTW